MKTMEKKTVKIRRLAASDVAPTLAIWWADVPEKDKVAAELQEPLDLSFIAEHEGVLVGLLLAKEQYSGYPMTGAGVISLVAVNPRYRQQGIGTMMIEELEKLCRRKNIRVIRAPIPDKDQEVISYFRSSHFRPSRIINYDKTVASANGK